VIPFGKERAASSIVARMAAAVASALVPGRWKTPMPTATRLSSSALMV
jgi:hypothetical protein